MAQTRTSNWPVVMSVAGSDNSGGAGIQADLKTFSALQVYGTTAVTCVVAEHPGRVDSIHAIPASMVGRQIDLTAETFPVAAVKTGMLHSATIIRPVAESFRRHGLHPVVDPVMVATSGARLLVERAEKALANELFPLASVVTPNLDEAAVLLCRKLKTARDAEGAAVELAEKWGVPFIVKGGHLRGPRSADTLAWPDGRTRAFESVRVPGVRTHGTGCTFSAALAAGLGRGWSLVQAISRAKRFVTRTIAGHQRSGRYDLLDHFHR